MKTNHHLFLLLAAMLLVQMAYGQVTNNVELPTSINSTGNAPNSSAILDVQSTTQGMLVPRMTTAQRTAISSPATGLLVFDTSMGGFWFYNGLSWVSLSGGGGSSHWQADTFNGGINYTDRIAVNHVETDSNAELYVYKTNTGAGESGIFARRQSSFTAFDGGSSWSDTGIDAAIKGFSQTGNTYSTAIYGSSYLDFNRSASVVGAHAAGATYGALGYKDTNGDILAGYFEGDVNVNGRAVVNGSINDDADLHITQSEYGEGKSAIKAYRSSSLNAGTSWGVDDVDGVIHSASYAGEQYNAALYGANDLTNAHNAGVVGYEIGGASYGALAYRDELNGIYAGYFQGDLQTNGNHGVTGTSNLNGDLNLGGDGYVTGDFNMNNDAYVTGDLQVTNGIATDGSLTVDGASNFNSGANVTGSLSIDDGTQAAGRVLTSDASGTASWQDAPSDGHWLETFNGIYRPTGSVGLGMAGAPVNSVMHINQLQSGANKAGLSVHRGALTSGGTDWSDAGVDAAIKGTLLSGSSYSAAVYGSSNFSGNWNAGVVGASNDGSTYAILAYQSSPVNTYAGYFIGDVAMGRNVGVMTDTDENYSLKVLKSPDNNGPGTSAIHANSFNSFSPDFVGGTGWLLDEVDAVISSYSTGGAFNAGIYSNVQFNEDNVAAVMGTSYGGSTMGMLCYRDSFSNTWAGYFQGRVRIKQNSNSNGLNFENHDNTNYWRLGINSVTENFNFYYNNSLRAEIASTDGAYIQSSDRSLKANIEYLEGVLPKVMALKPAKYHYKSSMDAAQKSHGFIAQEVQEIFPEIVRETEEGTLALAYDDFAILAVQAIKEQQEIIDGQNAKNSALENHVAKQDEKIEGQNNKIENLQNQLNEIKAMLENE